MSKKFTFRRDCYSLSDTELSLNRVDEPEVVMVKSTYLLPSDRHEALRILKAREGRKLNDLLLEAVDDLLYKYKRR